MSKIVRTSFDSMVTAARSEYEDQHRVHDGGAGYRKGEEVALGQRRAREYLAGGFTILKEAGLGLPTMAAIFASLSRTELALDETGCHLLRQAKASMEQGSLQLPSWDDLYSHLKCGPKMTAICKEVSVAEDKDKETFILALLVASEISNLCKAKEQSPVVATEATAVTEEPRAMVTIPQAEQALLDLAYPTTEAASRLLALPLESRGLAIVGEWDRAISAVPAREAVNAAERLGRRIEDVLDQLPTDERRTTFEHLVTDRRAEGGVNVVLFMVRGFAGDLSTTAQYLTSELVTEIYRTDPDLNFESLRLSRLVYLTWTLVVENPNKEPVIQFLTKTEAGLEILEELRQMAEEQSDEEAQVILRTVDETAQHIREDEERAANEDRPEES